ncbi:MAG: serine/threonine protein kinase, partial [Candidatus Obscuribacterales bacterium]|nr:serine/threonine protein kinase [Candidatus Obscuribacterales bacterium]
MTEESPPIVDASENDFFELPKIERYNVLELLGRGGMGVVVKATHLQLNKLVAIKVLHTSLLDQMSRKRFEIEAQAGSSLCHPNLVSVFDYGITEDGKPFMVMEFIDGKSLQYFLEEQGKMPVELFLPVFEQVAKGLQHIHNQNIVHRDIKTSNIMIQHIEGDLYAKLVDFGIAKILEQSGIPAQRLTETGSLFGSPLYMSPEQCRGLEVGVQSDIYSIGCVMYECLSGEPPIAGENALKTIFMHVNEDPPPLSELASDDATLKDIARLIHKCMNKDPEKRFQSGAELLSEFKRISESKEARRYQAGSAGNRWIKAAAQKKQPEKHCFEPEVLAENRRTVSFDTSSSTEQGAEIEIRFEGQTPESSLQGRKPTGQDLRREMAEIESRDPSRLLKMAVAGF